MHIKHQPEMVKMVENEILVDSIDKNKMKEMAKMDHSMATNMPIVFCLKKIRRDNLEFSTKIGNCM